MTNREIRELLLEIDTSEDIEVTSWEADFLQNILYDYPGRLSDKQCAAAGKIIARYLHV